MSSPLVLAFTPAEKEALTKFKADYLEKALAEVSSPSQEPEIWDVPMDKEDPRRDVIIVKFLRAKYPSLSLSSHSPFSIPASLLLCPLWCTYSNLLAIICSSCCVVDIVDCSKLVLPEAYQQFVKTLKWRREFDPRRAATEKHDSVYDTVGYVVGKDKKGRLITYNLYGGLDNEAVRLPTSNVHISPYTYCVSGSPVVVPSAFHIVNLHFILLPG